MECPGGERQRGDRQGCREPRPEAERLGAMAGSVDELVELLRRHLAGDAGSGKVFRATARDHRKTMALLFGDDDLCNMVVDRLLKQHQWPRLLELWTQGLAVDWNRLYGDVRPKRLGLPGYPFAKQRYWVEAGGASEPTSDAIKLHPLLHRNVSTLRQHAYASAFRGTEPFLVHAEGSESATLPASAFLEMARAAVQQSGGSDAGTHWRLSDIAWGETYAAGPKAAPLTIV